MLFTIAGAVVFPQILHLAGAALGAGGMLGQIFLPMYLPILILGFTRGRISGAIVGLLAPLVSFALTGMPTAALLPFITLELIATGWLAGTFSSMRLPAVLRVLSVQMLAKAVRLFALALSLYLTSGTLTASAVFSGILTSIPGVLLQLALVSGVILMQQKRSNAK